jgi:hypothetical protein
MDVLQFNVPPSLADGTIVNPHPDHQYPVIPERVTFVFNQVGDDWAVFAVERNANTGRLPAHAQNAFYRMSRDRAPADVRITGYGTDNTPAGAGGGRNAQSQTLQTQAGPYLRESVGGDNQVSLEYTADTMGGNSGSPIIELDSAGSDTSIALGIHTNGGCNPPDAGNFGTGFENNGLESAIHSFAGVNVIYVDRDHPVAPPDIEGAVLRPFRSVGAAINSVPTGGVLSIVANTYQENLTLNTAMTLVAPVGLVTLLPLTPRCAVGRACPDGSKCCEPGEPKSGGCCRVCISKEKHCP